MRKVTLTEIETSDQGTFGVWVSDSGKFTCFTGELPWRNNEPGLSCIPRLTFTCTYRFSPKHGRLCYHVEGVPGRSDIEIHSANLMGDRTKGLKCELLGCIAPGLYLEVREGQKGVWESREALLKLEIDLNLQPFELKIIPMGK